jgi:hypothetical protein
MLSKKIESTLPQAVGEGVQIASVRFAAVENPKRGKLVFWDRLAGHNPDSDLKIGGSLA